MTDSINPNVTMTLDEAVREVLSVLTGQTLSYDPDMDRFRAIALQLNRALRSNALEAEWGYYSDVIQMGPVQAGSRTFVLTTDWRFRVKNDDSVRFLDSDGVPIEWAYILPRDALHKYARRTGLWAAFTRNQLMLSRPLPDGLDGTTIEIPVMREPRPFVLPDDPMVPLTDDVLQQEIDFDFPDVVTARAAWLYAQTDPIMQPRVQTLESNYKDLMYQLMERDIAFTDTPYQNEFIVPVQNDIYGESPHRPWPVANRR